MPQNYVQKIVTLAGSFRAVEQPSAKDWQLVEAELQCVFPQDFKSLISALGSGTFGATLHLKNPRAASEYRRLAKQPLLEYCDLVGFIEDRIGIALYPASGGLVLIGEAERQHFAFQPRKSSSLLSELVRLDHDLEQVSKIPMSVSQFIHDLYLARISSDWADNLRAAIWGENAPFFTPLNT